MNRLQRMRSVTRFLPAACAPSLRICCSLLCFNRFPLLYFDHKRPVTREILLLSANRPMESSLPMR